jgi:hypothetical protein
MYTCYAKFYQSFVRFKVLALALLELEVMGYYTVLLGEWFGGYGMLHCVVG